MHYRKGLSAIELVVYVALFALVSVVAVDISKEAYSVAKKIRLLRKTTAEGALVMQKMLREIRDAYDINIASTSWDGNPGTLSLRAFTDQTHTSTTTADFYLSGGSLYFSKATTTVILTSPDVTVSAFVFRRITTPHSPGVKIELRLVASTSAFRIEAPLYSTAILRGSY